jgi:hypothetical protein
LNVEIALPGLRLFSAFRLAEIMAAKRLDFLKWRAKVLVLLSYVGIYGIEFVDDLLAGKG